MSCLLERGEVLGLEGSDGLGLLATGRVSTTSTSRGTTSTSRGATSTASTTAAATTALAGTITIALERGALGLVGLVVELEEDLVLGLLGGLLLGRLLGLFF